MKLVIDPDLLTIDDIIFLEDETGKPMTRIFSDMQKSGDMSAKALRAFIFLQERRTNKAFTLEMAGRYSLNDVELVAGDDVVDPTGVGSGEM